MYVDFKFAYVNDNFEPVFARKTQLFIGSELLEIKIWNNLKIRERSFWNDIVQDNARSSLAYYRKDVMKGLYMDWA